MSLKKLLSTLRGTKLPYHISGDEIEQESHVCFDENVCCQARKLFMFETYIDSPRGSGSENSSILLKFPASTFLQTPENLSAIKFDKKNIATQRKKLVKNYFQNDEIIHHPKIRSLSVERVMPSEVCMFRRYDHTIKEVKKKCNLNLWYELEMVKKIYKAQRTSSLQSLIQDFGCLVFDFIFSPIRRLRFDECKNIFEKLEEIENSVTEKLKARSNFRSSTQFAPNPQNQKTSNINDFLKNPKAHHHTRKMPNSSVITILPQIFGTLTGKTDGSHTAGLGITRLPSNVNDRPLYEKFLRLINKTKFLMAQIAHLLHYEQLSNRLSEIITSRDVGKRSFTGLVSNSSLEQSKPIDSNRYSINSIAPYYSNASVDLEEEKHHSTRADTSIFDQTTHSNRLNNYLFESQSFLDDFDDHMVEKRLEKLHKYCVYKAKKWFTQKKKEQVEEKYEKFEIVCKICEQKIHLEKVREHSRLCRLKAEALKGLKDADNKISEIVFEAFMKAKQFETSLRIDRIISQ